MVIQGLRYKLNKYFNRSILNGKKYFQIILVVDRSRLYKLVYILNI